MQFQTLTLKTPIGPMSAIWGRAGLIALSWQDRRQPVSRHLDRHLSGAQVHSVSRLAELEEAISAYLAGELDALSALPADPPGTQFQRTVWAALRDIPAGQTCSYGDLARAIGRPRAVRAVAQANGANPAPLVIPCHRVIAADGGLGGFSAGLERKRWLLAHEGAWFDPAQRQTYLWKSKAGSEKPRATTSNPT